MKMNTSFNRADMNLLLFGRWPAGRGKQLGVRGTAVPAPGRGQSPALPRLCRAGGIDWSGAVSPGPVIWRDDVICRRRSRGWVCGSLGSPSCRMAPTSACQPLWYIPISTSLHRCEKIHHRWCLSAVHWSDRRHADIPFTLANKTKVYDR